MSRAVREDAAVPYTAPSRLERQLNRLIGVLVRLGLAPAHMRLLQVRGRRTGRTHALPVDVLEHGGRLYLVAPRGLTHWVRNADAAGTVTLRRGGSAVTYRVRVLGERERPAILSAYLDRFRREVQRYFPVPAGSPASAFAGLAARYPVFELVAEAPPHR